MGHRIPSPSTHPVLLVVMDLEEIQDPDWADGSDQVLLRLLRGSGEVLLACAYSPSVSVSVSVSVSFIFSGGTVSESSSCSRGFGAIVSVAGLWSAVSCRLGALSSIPVVAMVAMTSVVVLSGEVIAVALHSSFTGSSSF